jgi:hypothetical protein
VGGQNSTWHGSCKPPSQIFIPLSDMPQGLQASINLIGFQRVPSVAKTGDLYQGSQRDPFYLFALTRLDAMFEPGAYLPDDRDYMSESAWGWVSGAYHRIESADMSQSCALRSESSTIIWARPFVGVWCISR